MRAAGKVEENQVTGQITTTFDTATDAEGKLALHDGLPQLPFTTFTLSFRQGQTSPLITPPACGAYTASGLLTPWSNLNRADPGVYSIFRHRARVSATSECPPGGVPPFNPQVSAGTENNAAGAYSPLGLEISRNDGEQEITGFATQFPAGVTGNLTGVEKCTEADVQRAREQSGVQAETEPACPKGSEIGYSIAEAGVGSVLAQNPGKIYLGEGYDGAPFSVVAVTARARRPVRPRHGSDPLPPADQPRNRRGQHSRGRGGSDPAHHQGHRHPRPQHPRLHQPRRLHDQPDELRPGDPFNNGDRRGREHHEPGRQRPGTVSTRSRPRTAQISSSNRDSRPPHPRRPAKPTAQACT